jgi:predicted regulator of Ras-like GTPase activity (Roadblock/LC7/MglB family)
MPDSTSRASRLDRALADLLAQAPEVEAAAVVSFDGLPMASALPATMDEDRVAAMSAALLSLGERAAEGLGRGSLNQVYIEGEHGTVFLVSADDEAVLVAVAAKAAKVGMMLYEVRRAAAVVAEVLRAEDAVAEQDVAEVPSQPEAATYETPSYETPSYETPSYNPESYDLPRYDALDAPVAEAPAPTGSYAPAATDTTWPSYLPNGSGSSSAEPTPWS